MGNCRKFFELPMIFILFQFLDFSFKYVFYGLTANYNQNIDVSITRKRKIFGFHILMAFLLFKVSL